VLLEWVDWAGYWQVVIGYDDTAKPRVRAKPPPLVIGTTTGILVSRLKAPCRQKGPGSIMNSRNA